MINRKQLYTNQTSSRWKKVNQMRHFTVIADLNVAQKEISNGDLSFFLLILFQYMSALYVGIVQLVSRLSLNLGFRVQIPVGA